MQVLTQQELHNLAMNIVGKKLEKMGYEKIIVSSYSKGVEKKNKHIQIVPCAKIEEVVRAVFA